MYINKNNNTVSFECDNCGYVMYLTEETMSFNNDNKCYDITLKCDNCDHESKFKLEYSKEPLSKRYTFTDSQGDVWKVGDRGIGYKYADSKPEDKIHFEVVMHQNFMKVLTWTDKDYGPSFNFVKFINSMQVKNREQNKKRGLK